MPDGMEFRGVTFHSGDFVSLFSLFFDNLSTLLGFSGAILGVSSQSTIVSTIVYERIIPAACIMLFLGNVYYTWQAVRMRKKWGKDYTAQPYGLNTAGGFPFIFGIIYGTYFAQPTNCTDEVAAETGCDPIEEDNNKVILAWQVCVSANFLTGLINIFLGFFGDYLLKLFPVAAMLVPIAGIGFTWLALNQIAPNFETPAIGLIPVYLIFTQYYGKGRIHIYNGWYLPEAIPIVIFGTIAGWVYGLNDTVVDPVTPGVYIGGAFIEGFKEIGPYIGIVLPFSIAASFLDLMCLVSAQKAGDPYPIRETMIVDGIGTLIGALLGSPFGTVIYVGHPVHKRVGAQTGYSIMNGCIYLILGLSGIIPVILSLIPVIAIGPIIFIFGLMICEECTYHLPQRHHCAIFFGIFFGICDYIYLTFAPGNTLNGQNAMSKGSALASMIWVAIVVYTIDRRWLRAAVFCVIGGGFAGMGLIHQDQAFKEFMDGFQDIDNTSPFQFMMGYLSLAGVALIYYCLQTFFGKKTKEGEEGYELDYGYDQPIEEAAVDNLFETWWDPAKEPHGQNEEGDALTDDPDISKKTKRSNDEESSDDVENPEEETEIKA